MYVRALHKVIDESNVIIVVLDARDPEGCRSRLVEEEVRRRESEGKRLVFVLNKIATSHQQRNLSCATAPALLRLLKACKPSAAQSVTVGVVGFPNVGKGSSINSLKRSKVCAVAAQPGHTRDLQTVRLERGLKIIDSPGVVFDKDEDGIGQHQKGSILLRNVVKVEDIDDPIGVVEEILYRTEHATLQNIYGLPEFSSTLEFLTMLALSCGRLHKGGTPDVLAAARHMLTDWNHQKIPSFSVPPMIHPSSIPSTITNSSSGTGGTVAPGAETVGQAHIRTELSKPFELAGLFGVADAGAFASEEVVIMDDNDDGGMMNRLGEAMVADDGAVHLPLKRSHSLVPEPEPDPELLANVALHVAASEASFVRTPKRLRKARDLSAYEEAAAKSHPLCRKTLKRNAERAGRAAARLQRTNGEGEGVGMEVDVDGLENTFMTGVEC